MTGVVGNPLFVEWPSQSDERCSLGYVRGEGYIRSEAITLRTIQDVLSEARPPGEVCYTCRYMLAIGYTDYTVNTRFGQNWLSHGCCGC